MKRLTLTALIASALLAPGAVSAQSASPEASAAPQPIGVDTMHVCLAINGPVTLLTAETLTQGIIDRIFVIEGLSTECEVGMDEDPSTSSTDDPATGEPADESPSPAP